MNASWTLDDETLRLLSGTAAADADGNPLVLHHGTVHRFEKFGKTVDLGYHFGSMEQAAKRLDTMPASALMGGDRADGRIVSVALAVRNPLLMMDDPGTWEPGHVGSTVARLLGRKRTGRTQMADIREWLAEAGHDAVVYRNMVESARKSRCVEFSWLVLSPEQIVILGEDVKAQAVAMPEGMRGPPGYDPEAASAALGGFRFASGRLQKAADRKAFGAAFVALMQEIAPDEPGKDHFGVGLAWSWRDGDREFKVEMNPGLGRVRIDLMPWSHDDVEDICRDVTCDGSTYGFEPSIRTTHPRFWSEWTPGESLDTAIARCRDMVLEAVEAVSDGPAPAFRP